ncbi:MAG: SRPBCC family protein [Anaerolineae bacterium]|nr:SRPBCC family protein [Anaerolineae bacterium]
MNVNLHAPLIARKEILINAPISQVWTTLTDINNWPEWQPDVNTARLEGELAQGTVFRWKALGLNITSVIRELATHKKIGWTGRSIGMQAIHIWTFESLENGVQVSTQESLDGWFPRLLKLFDREFLSKSLTASLQVLKKEAERRAGSGNL